MKQIWNNRIFSNIAGNHRHNSGADQQRLLKNTLQQKFLLLCGLIVVLMAGGISTTYFIMARQEKQQQSQQRLQVAFDMALNDIVRQAHAFSQVAKDFLHESKSIRDTASAYAAQLLNQRQNQMLQPIMLSYLRTVTEELSTFARIVSADRVVLYGVDASILAMYQNSQGEQTVGISVLSSSGNQSYLSLDDSVLSSRMLAGIVPIPDRLFPYGVSTHFTGAIPNEIVTKFFNEAHRMGIRAIVPIQSSEGKTVGVMTCDSFYTQEWIEQYARLSQTALNLFIGDELSIGSFREQTELPDYAAASFPPVRIETLLRHVNVQQHIPAVSMTFDQQKYYQARYQFLDENQVIYTLTASVSKDEEDREIRKMLFDTLTISVMTMLIVFGLSVVLSQRTMRALQELLRVMEALETGNLRRTALVSSQDEFGLLAFKLNEVIVRMRDISLQTKAVSGNVTMTADSILQETAQLFRMMEQQTVSVDHTREAIEQIDGFIDSVVANIAELSEITEQILHSVSQMSLATEQVAVSTNHLNHDVGEISLFADQVKDTSQHIFQHGAHLLRMVQETEASIQQIGALLVNVSENAAQSKQLARETLDVGLEGQHAVQSSIEGILRLKDMTTKSTQIMRDVHHRTTEVGSILDFVDDIAEKTGLLSLNASIIAAQAGVHGKGFAVIASEIRELSALTKSSTKEIYQVIAALRKEVELGVKNVSNGMSNVDESVKLIGNVEHSLHTIIDRARQSSERASHTVRMIEDTVSSSTQIQQAMEIVTEMTADIQQKLEHEECDLQLVTEAIENISAMSEEMKQATFAHTREADRVYEQMQCFTRNLHNISDQTHELQSGSNQIIGAMQSIETVTDTIVQNTITLSGHTIQKLIRQSIALQERLNVFQVE